ncbi:MAG TPA: DUF4321 domain-containing protein [Elusimicrobiales bacterium]|nr:DUF4321 domain-containing protein [Elusimicrobiales bacterium]
MRNVFYISLVITAGALLGNLLGKLVAALFHVGPIRDAFALQLSPGFDPFTLNLIIVRFTFGFRFTLNVAGVLGIIIAAVIARKLFKK